MDTMVRIGFLLMSGSSHIRHVSKLEIVVELCLLFSTLNLLNEILDTIHFAFNIFFTECASRCSEITPVSTALCKASIP